MISKCKSLFSIFVYFFTLACYYISADEVPVFMFNMKGNSLNIKSVAALDHHDEIFADIMKKNKKVLVFAVDKMSLEDLYENDKPSNESNTFESAKRMLDEKEHLLLSVIDPLNHIHKAHCGIQEFVIEQDMDKTMFQSINSGLQRSCIVIVHISTDLEFPLLFEENLFNDKNILGVFTARESSWGSSNNDHHAFRNLLATADPDPNFVNFTGCIIMYAENATLSFGSGSNNTVVNLAFPVTTDGSECSSNSTVLQINFPASGSVSAVALKFSFRRSGGSWKTKSTVTITGGKAPEGELDLDSQYIDAPIGFSYSCGKLDLKAKKSQTLTEPVTITIDRFQVQPFEVNEKFSESFDCVPFFTIPIWMGIFVSILFIVITNIGIYALFSVHTMDRFDDPKGKTISVATTVD